MEVGTRLFPPQAVVCRNVNYQYPQGSAALTDFSLTIFEGEKVGVIGPNGAGKSTLLSLLNGLLRAAGEIRIFEHVIERRNSALIRSLAGLVFQNPDDQLFCPTILEDVAFGPLNMGLKKDQALDCVRTALDEVGLSGYENRSSLQLSFGEKKLAAIASILSMQPRLVLMDEPTSNLDAMHRRKIMRWIESTNRTCVITSHDLDMIWATCSRVVLIRNGRLIREGKTEEILSDQALLEANHLELPLAMQSRPMNAAQ